MLHDLVQSLGLVVMKENGKEDSFLSGHRDPFFGLS
jgi:hypothetical protein